MLPLHSSDIVFLGNSITDGCEWAELFENRHVKNRGISGDRSGWLLERLDSIIAARIPNSLPDDRDERPGGGHLAG